jgi:hypothetical protein
VSLWLLVPFLLYFHRFVTGPRCGIEMWADERALLDPGRLADEVLRRACVPVLLAVVALALAALPRCRRDDSSPASGLACYWPAMTWALLEVRSLAGLYLWLAATGAGVSGIWFGEREGISVAALFLVIALCITGDSIIRTRAGASEPASSMLRWPVVATVGSIVLLWTCYVGMVLSRHPKCTP